MDVWPHSFAANAKLIRPSTVYWLTRVEAIWSEVAPIEFLSVIPTSAFSFPISTAPLYLQRLPIFTTSLIQVTTENRYDRKSTAKQAAKWRSRSSLEPACRKPVWYIFAMVRKTLTAFAILLAITHISVPISAQNAGHPAPASGQGTIPADSNSKPPSTASSPDAASNSAQGQGAPADASMFPLEQQRQAPVVVTVPSPGPAPWLIRDQITWGANLVLVLLGYIGIMVALSALRKIERRSRSVELAAAAAADSAHAALLNAQAIMDAGRPWLLISVVPSPDIENSFAVMATNRGRSPARIVGTAEQIRFAVDEMQLARTPVYPSEELTAPPVPIILLPGESAEMKPFSREDLKSICDSEERLKSVENWEEKVYLYGKVIYRDLTAPPDKPNHETAWCCWYIHGRQKSGLVFAGPADYNAHT